MGTKRFHNNRDIFTNEEHRFASDIWQVASSYWKISHSAISVASLAKYYILSLIRITSHLWIILHNCFYFSNIHLIKLTKFYDIPCISWIFFPTNWTSLTYSWTRMECSFIFVNKCQCAIFSLFIYSQIILCSEFLSYFSFLSKW